MENGRIKIFYHLIFKRNLQQNSPGKDKEQDIIQFRVEYTNMEVRLCISSTPIVHSWSLKFKLNINILY